MAIRKALSSDLDRALEIYSVARDFMKASGNPEQWGRTYPPRELVEADISGEKLYVLEDELSIYGLFAFFPEGEPLYEQIDGAWLNDLPHSAIHRVASDGSHRGVLAEIVSFCLSQSNNLKIDTHKDNLPMQAALKKQGFIPCGIILLENGEERIAFQLFL